MKISSNIKTIRKLKGFQTLILEAGPVLNITAMDAPDLNSATLVYQGCCPIDGESGAALLNSEKLSKIGNANKIYLSDSSVKTPVMPKLSSFLTIDTLAFKELIRRAVSVNTVHYGYTYNVQIKLNNTVEMLSTDGPRLVSIKEHVSGFMGGKIETALVLKKNLAKAARFLTGHGIVKIGVNSGYFIIKKAAESIYVLLNNDEFPDCTAIINKAKTGKAVQVNRRLFQNVLGRFVEDSVDFSLGEDKFIISSNEFEETIPVSFVGEWIELCFNPWFFTEGLKLMKGEYITIYLSNESTPCLLEDINRKFLYLIMPKIK